MQVFQRSLSNVLWVKKELATRYQPIRFLQVGELKGLPTHVQPKREGRPQGTSNPKCAGLLSCCWGGRKPQLPWQRPPPGPMANSLQGDVTQLSWLVDKLGEGWISDPHQHLRGPSWTHSTWQCCQHVSVSQYIHIYVCDFTHTHSTDRTHIHQTLEPLLPLLTVPSVHTLCAYGCAHLWWAGWGRTQNLVSFTLQIHVFPGRG